jgi:type II secretory pathway pseudopilin PulG
MKRALSIGAVLAFVAFLAWAIVPDFLRARNRHHQRETMADMRSIATAWEARATDINSYSVGAEHETRAGDRRKTTAERRVTVAELAHALEPTYIRKLPRTDAWGTAFQFSTRDAEGSGQAQNYTIRSLGSDGRPDRIANLSGSTTDFRDDLIYANGAFIRYPEEAG